ncbi:MAG TPA: ComEC/Rec2 family competence protein [Dehalococcoidia bacterium]|nr:ComEC/Rec2 family competence protein [Dehalococcoidia bacterium]
MPLIYLSCAWVAGIFAGASVALHPAIVLIGLMPLPLLFWFRRHRRAIILTSLCVIAFLGGALYFQSSRPANDETSLQFYNEQGTVEIKGVVDTEPEVRDRVSHLRLAASEIKLIGGWQPVSGMVLLFVPRYPTYEYGDQLQVTGSLETPPQLDDFDYRDYLAHQGIHSTMLYPDIEKLGGGHGSKLRQWLYALRSRLSQSLAEVLPEPQASLAQGIVLGNRSMIPDPVETAFTHSGTAHLLAISGLHLGILAVMLVSLGIRLFGRRHYIYAWLALAIIWLYALITGMHPPVTRAAIMASLFLVAELLGRQRSAISALTFAAAIMVGLNPQILWQASFQMSFLAMTGLIFIFPPLQAAGKKAVRATLGEDGAAASTASIATDSLSASLGAILAVWPLVAYYFRYHLIQRPPGHILRPAGTTGHHHHRGPGRRNRHHCSPPGPGHRLARLAVHLLPPAGGQYLRQPATGLHRDQRHQRRHYRRLLPGAGPGLVAQQSPPTGRHDSSRSAALVKIGNKRNQRCILTTAGEMGYPSPAHCRHTGINHGGHHAQRPAQGEFHGCR